MIEGLLLPDKRSNKALQPTATRCALTFRMTKMVLEISAALPVVAAELVSR